jgi:hypothetical protein
MQDRFLLQSIYDSLSIFGENTKASLLANLQAEGIGFTSDSFDIDKFCKVLQDLLGPSAGIVFARIFDETRKKLNLSPEQSQHHERAYHYKSNADLLRVLFEVTK